MRRPKATYNYATAPEVVLNSAMVYARFYYSPGEVSWYFMDGAYLHHNHDDRPFIMLPNGEGKLLFQSYEEYGQFVAELTRRLHERDAA